MRRTTIAKLKNGLSRYLRFVRQGEVVVVLDRKEPIAEICPVSSRGRGGGSRLARLEAEGIVRRGDRRILEHWTAPQGKGPAGVLDTLLEERGTGR